MTGRTVLRCTALAAAAAVLLPAQGCVTRSITVKSDPPDAHAFLDEKYLGKTPVTVPFRHYGVRRIRLQKEGFQTVSRAVRLDPPWYQVIVLDLICEVLIPYRFRDEREFFFTLEKPVRDREAFLERARRKRESFLEGEKGFETGTE